MTSVEPLETEAARPLCFGDIIQDATRKMAVLQPDRLHGQYVVRVFGGSISLGNFQISHLVFPITRIAYAVFDPGRRIPRLIPDGTVFRDPVSVSDILYVSQLPNSKK